MKSDNVRYYTKTKDEMMGWEKQKSIWNPIFIPEEGDEIQLGGNSRKDAVDVVVDNVHVTACEGGHFIDAYCKVVE